MESSGDAERSKYRYNDIVEKLQGMIESGELKMGDRLPPERHLALSFGVSRTCIRQAIQALAMQHRLDSRQGNGTYVCAPDPALLAKSFAQAFAVQKEMLRDIIEFRLLLEPQIAALAARHITPEELNKLKILVCDQERKILSGFEDGKIDAAFHLLLAEASRNQVIHQVFRAMQDIVNECRAEFLQTEARKRASVVAHLKIIDALEEADPDKAAQVMREHLRQVEKLLLGGEEQMIKAEKKEQNQPGEE
jgi:GntR family transcriptional repressor for pyruvate dehydrogenase complex